MRLTVAVPVRWPLGAIKGLSCMFWVPVWPLSRWLRDLLPVGERCPHARNHSVPVSADRMSSACIGNLLSWQPSGLHTASARLLLWQSPPGLEVASHGPELASLAKLFAPKAAHAQPSSQDVSQLFIYLFAPIATHDLRHQQ